MYQSDLAVFLEHKGNRLIQGKIRLSAHVPEYVWCVIQVYCITEVRVYCATHLTLNENVDG